MNVPFLAVLFLDAIFAVTETGASRRWRWNGKSRHKHWDWNQGKTDPICSSGKCVLAWKCPEEAILRESRGSCPYWTNGPWVCCDLTQERSHGAKTNSATKPSTPAAGGYSREAATKRTTTANPNKNLSTPSPWNRNARVKPTPFSSTVDILRNRENRSITSSPVYNPTKIPLTGVRKTTEDPRNRRTTPTSFTRSTRIKTTLDPRIVFPTKSTKWVSKNPSFNTPTTSTMRSTSSTTRAAWQPSTRQPGRTVSTSTRRPAVPTRSWVGDSGERRRSTPTTSYPNRGSTTSSRTPDRRGSSSTTAGTTKRNRITTPLPNVNTYMCGIRQKKPAPSRQGRNYNLAYESSVDVFHSDSRNMKHRQPYERIVGGEESEPFSWPWVAALYKVGSSGGHSFLSAGSLINEHFVLTAAHVFTPGDLRTASFVAMLGTHDAQDAVAEYLVASVVRHPNYENRYYYHDIALLRLVKPVYFNNYVMPVCLPSPNAPLLRDRDLEGKTVTVMGWGDESFGGRSSRVLKEATFSISSRTSCNASYVRVASNRFPRGITDEMLCAGDPNGGKDACQGDSGGPLTSMVNGRYTQVGIVSFGYQCGDKEFPGVYTKVAPYLSWIAENTRSIEEHDTDYHNDYDYRG